MSDGSTPKTSWSVELPAAGGGSLDVVAHGLLMTGPGWLALFSLEGERRWVTDAVTTAFDWPVMLDEHTVGQIEQGHVVIRACGTGAVSARWPAPMASNLAPAPWGDVLFIQVGEDRKRMVRCASRDGRERWAVPLSSDPPDFPRDPFAVSDTVLIPRAGALWAYDQAGAARWMVDRTGLHAPADEQVPARGDRVKLATDALSIDRDRAFVQLSWYESGGMMEIDGRSPSMRQITERRPLRLPLAVLPVSDGSYRLAGSRGQVDIGHMDYVYPIRVLRPDGTTVWEHQLPARPTSLAATPDGGFVTSGTPTERIWREYGKWQDLSDQMFVRLIDAAGAEVWTWYAPGPITHAAVAARDGTVYVCSDGRLFALTT
jgi:putative pyrroloquinoline-quinone-binding quinoprotein